MKKILFILLFGMLASCEEVIQVELENAEPRLVVEGSISEGQTAQVKLSLTSSFFDEIEPIFVENATVEITDVQGQITEELIYSGQGMYLGQSVLGVQLKDYRLRIEYDGVTYESTSKLYPPAEIQSVNFNKISGGFSVGAGLASLIEIKSNHSEAYYCIEYDRKDTSLSSVLAIDLQEPVENGMLDLFVNPQFLVEEGDSVFLTVKTIDKAQYDYLVGLNDLAGNNNQGGGATPYNPLSNFEPEVLGSFYAYSQESKDTIAIQ